MYIVIKDLGTVIEFLNKKIIMLRPFERVQSSYRYIIKQLYYDCIDVHNINVSHVTEPHFGCTSCDWVSFSYKVIYNWQVSHYPSLLYFPTMCWQFGHVCVTSLQASTQNGIKQQIQNLQKKEVTSDISIVYWLQMYLRSCLSDLGLAVNVW